MYFYFEDDVYFMNGSTIFLMVDIFQRAYIVPDHRFYA